MHYGIYHKNAALLCQCATQPPTQRRGCRTDAPQLFVIRLSLQLPPLDGRIIQEEERWRRYQQHRLCEIHAILWMAARQLKDATHGCDSKHASRQQQHIRRQVDRRPAAAAAALGRHYRRRRRRPMTDHWWCAASTIHHICITSTDAQVSIDRTPGSPKAHWRATHECHRCGRLAGDNLRASNKPHSISCAAQGCNRPSRNLRL